MHNDPQSPADPDHPASHPVDSPDEISSEQLLRGRQEILIRHGEELYRLRLTRNGKLILQK